MASKDSKSNFALLRNKILSQSGKNYWRSVEEYVDAPEFAEFVSQEYPQHAEEWSDSFSRRNFIKIMGASLALAGLSGCVIQPAEKIVPYVKAPEEMVPGKPLYFATAMTLGGVATGLLGCSNEGRPTKIEGNPEHGGSLGATHVFAQAEILSLYDPDRSQKVLYRTESRTWQAFVAEFRGQIEDSRQTGGTGIRFLSETVTSPTLIAQFKQIASELPNAKWYQYEPANKDNVYAGAKLAFGSPVNTVYNFEKAARILTLDADIFGGTNVRYLKDFAKGRGVGHGEEKHEMNRLYAIETTLSLTGAKADHRLGVKPSEFVEIVKAVAKAVGVAGAVSTISNKWVEEMAKDLAAYKGKSLVVAGDNQPAVVHALAHAINGALGNVGQTVTYTDPLSAFAETPQVDGLRELIKDIDAGAVKMLVILGGNPVYNTPSDLKLTKERMDKVPMRVHLSQSFDETSELCYWHVNAKHFLESWSDTRAFDGTVTITQPLVQPLYDGKSAHEIVQLFAKENFEKKEMDIVKDYWKANGLADEKTWRKAIHDGVVANTALPSKAVTANTAFLSQPTPAASGSGNLEFTILPDPSVYDGRYANNGWLQELPNPLTKITWDNVALISPKTAAELKLNQGAEGGAGGSEGTAFINTKGGNLFSDLVEVTYQGGKITQKVPVWIQPGQPDGVVTLYLGYGRTKAGRVGSGLGYNAYEVQKSDALWFGKGELKATGEKTTIASSQTHFNIEGRETEILRTFDYETWEKDAEATHQHDEAEKSMFPPHDYSPAATKNKWGLAIDLNSCVGCNACVIACQSENNIPVVGKEQVERSREMHWMRVDAYFEGSDINNPDAINFQPMLCQQCELAPCELVCPVHATVHSAEGLNDMVYNRCIGTRYCSNNCPYKVRRFNFMLYQDWNTPQYKLMRNPEVSIRSRGVMEKCTYCTQRIAAARIEAEKEGRPVRDGEVVTACEAVCPTDAIVFGNLNDESSRVTKLHKDHRTYNVLNSLNTQPRTRYLAGLRNQNKSMPDYKAQEWVEKEIKAKGESKGKTEGSH